MKNLSLDNLYIKINKHLKLIESYLEIEQLSNVFKACRLKPRSFIFGKRTYKIVLIDEWVDEYGNSLKIDKKKINIKYNDISIDRQKIVCTDMYYGIDLSRVAKMSKMAHLMIGRDEDTYQNCYTITFLGIDNYLRTFIYYYDEWIQISPLYLGIKTLINIIKHHDITYSRKLNNKENMPVPCLDINSWLISFPLGDGFLSFVNKEHEILGSIFKI